MVKNTGLLWKLSCSRAACVRLKQWANRDCIQVTITSISEILNHRARQKLTAESCKV